MMSRHGRFKQTALRLWWHTLNRYPVLVNCATFATFYAGAEISQQTFNKFYMPSHPPIDWQGTGRIMLAGSTFHPIMFHFWYKYLDAKYPGVTLKNVYKKMFADQVCLTPVSMFLFFAAVSYLENQNLLQNLIDKFGILLIANSAFWLPAQLINFVFISSQYRILYISIVSFVWINVLCYIRRSDIDHIYGSEYINAPVRTHKQQRVTEYKTILDTGEIEAKEIEIDINNDNESVEEKLDTKNNKVNTVREDGIKVTDGHEINKSKASEKDITSILNDAPIIVDSGGNDDDVNTISKKDG